MNKCAVQTPIGCIYAVPSGDQQNYPGIVIGLERDGKTAEFVLVECCKNDEELTGNLNLHVWNMDQFVWNSDPVYEQSATPEEVTEMMEGEVE